MFNKVILVGNLTRDPELRYLQSNSAVCNTGIAVNRKYKLQTGEQKEEVCFVDIALFGRTAEIANQYLKKGSKVLVEGRLKLDQWNDQSGAKRSRHSVVVESLKMLDSKGSQDSYQQPNNDYQQNYDGHSQYQNTQSQQSYKPTSNQNQHQDNSIPEINIDDDSIPF